MASFFKTLFRKDEDSQPVPAAPLTNDAMASSRPALFPESGENPSAARHSVPSSQSSPFAAVSGRHMTAREIAALLPHALLRFDGINPDQAVPLPVGPLRESMQAGRPFLRLSQIQQACPALFQRPLLADEDVEITFPLARVKGILDFSAPQAAPTARAATPPPPAGNPFETIQPISQAPAASPFAPVASVADINPFANLPPANRSATSPFAPMAPPASAAPAPAPATSPFAVAAPAASAESPFTAPSVSPPTLSPTPDPVSASPFAVAASAPAPAASAGFPIAAAPAPAPTPLLGSSLPPSSATTLTPSPFAAVASPAKPTFLPAGTAPMASASRTAPGAPPAVQNGAALPILPRTSPIPAHRTAPVPPPAARTAPLAPAAAKTSPVIASPFAAVGSIASAPTVVAAPPVAPALAALEPVAAPVSSPFLAATPTGPAASLELSLRAVLRDASPEELGFAPENVPEAVRVSLALDSIVCQLATGRVEVGLTEVCAGIPEKFRPAFARVVPCLRITIPMSEVFHNLPESARPTLPPAAPVAPVEAHQAITTSPFQTPFAIRPEEDTSRQTLDLSVTGFDPTNLPVRPATQPVPTSVLPPAPLPPIQPAVGGPPVAQVELPALRPASAPPADIQPLPALLPRPGLLSRAPGSATAPTTAPLPLPVKTPPRLQSGPISPTLLKPFPKPTTPQPEVAGISLPFVSASPQQDATPPLVFPPAPALGGIAPALAPVVSKTEPVDDLGESFSAARLGAEPPPRAGSAPIGLPVAVAAPAVAPSTPWGARATTLPAGLPLPGSAAAARAPESAPALTFPPAAPIAETPATPWPPPAVPVANLAPAAPSLPAAVDQTPEPLTNSQLVAAIPSTSPIEDLSFGCVSDITQLTLRAVLGVDTGLTRQDIVDRCALLPGLKACVLLQPNATLTSQGMDETQASAFRASAAKTRDSLTTLAETMGLGSGGNFTLRTDLGIRSFFLENNLCLAVWHAQPQFTPGTREKLILITQELAKP